MSKVMPPEQKVRDEALKGLRRTAIRLFYDIEDAMREHKGAIPKTEATAWIEAARRAASVSYSFIDLFLDTRFEEITKERIEEDLEGINKIAGRFDSENKAENSSRD